MTLLGRFVAFLGVGTGLLLDSLGVINIFIVFGVSFCIGIGNGLTLPSANAGIMSARPGLAGSASGMSGAMSVAIGAGVSVLAGLAAGWGPAPVMMLGLMTVTAGLSLAAALFVLRLERRLPLPAADTKTD